MTNTNLNATQNKERSNEFINIHGLTAFQFGEVIKKRDTAKIFLTAVNCAISATRIKRERTKNAMIAMFLNNLDSLLKYAWKNIDEYGVIHLFDRSCKEYCEDYIEDAIVELVQLDGEIYTNEKMRIVRNAVDRQLYKVEQKIINEADTDKVPAYKPMYDSTKFSNKFLKIAIKKCEFDAITIDIIVRVSNGESRRAIAKDIRITEGAIRKRYNKAIEKLQEIIEE